MINQNYQPTAVYSFIKCSCFLGQCKFFSSGTYQLKIRNGCFSDLNVSFLPSLAFIWTEGGGRWSAGWWLSPTCWQVPLSQWLAVREQQGDQGEGATEGGRVGGQVEGGGQPLLQLSQVLRPGGCKHQVVQQLWHSGGIRSSDVHKRQRLCGLSVKGRLHWERGFHDDPSDCRGDPGFVGGLQCSRLLPRFLCRRVLRRQRSFWGVHKQPGRTPGAECTWGDF